MSTEVANRSSTAVAALQGLRAGLQNVKANIVAASGEPLLRLIKSGMWVYGQENVEVEPGSRWAVNPLTIKHGWVAWTDRPGKEKNEVVGEVMVPATSPLPPEASLHDVKVKDPTAEWAQQLTFDLACVFGEDKGTQVLYKTTSVGGSGAVSSLIEEIMKRIDTHPDTPVPIIELDTSSYIHTKWGLTYTPVFTVRSWVGLEDTEVPADEPEPAPARQQAAPARQRRQPAADAPAKTDVKEPEPGPEDELAALERQIAEAKARKAAAEDPVAAKRRELEAQLAALTGGGAQAEPQPAGQSEAAGQPAPQRRRRNA